MATGYTMKIEEGQSFKDFVLKCSEAFSRRASEEGELKEHPVDEYHKEELEKAKKELLTAGTLTTEQAEVEVEKKYTREVKDCEDSIQENKDLRLKYETMLTKVNNWKAPTSKHIPLKEFMVEQIQSSIKHDCYYVPTTPKKQTPQEWLDAQIKSAQWNVDYHKKEWEESLERNKGNNNWVRNLKESLVKIEVQKE